MKLKGLDPWVEILNKIYWSINISDYLYSSLKKCDPSYRQIVSLAFACAKWDNTCLIDRGDYRTCALCVLSRDINYEIGIDQCSECILKQAGQKCIAGENTLYEKYCRYPTYENRQAMQDFLVNLYIDEYEKVVR